MDRKGRNQDWWTIPPGGTKVLAELDGPGRITHIWMTQPDHYREVLIRITWDHASAPSVLVPLGDFFCLGHGIVNSFQSALFSASTNENHKFNRGPRSIVTCQCPSPAREDRTGEPIQTCPPAVFSTLTTSLGLDH